MFGMKFRWLVACCLLFSVLSCNDGFVSNKYCSLPAKLTVNPVISVLPLYQACENMGEFCTITVQNNNFVFDNITSSLERPKDAALIYTGYYMGVNGFIVGLPNIPELGSDYPVVTCYDLVCPNCIDAFSVYRKVTLQRGGYAYCSRCQRTYNLNNIGIVCSGESGRSLYRYRVYYGNDTLTINNR